MLIRSEKGSIYNFDHVVSIEIKEERTEAGKARYYINARLAGTPALHTASFTVPGIAELTMCDTEAEAKAKQIMQRILRNDRQYLDLLGERNSNG